jgi:solute carrier family 25 thiamine pyrophosphate transporter 19
VIAPLDVLKIRLQLQQSPRASALSTISQIVRTEGPTALWKGNIPAELLYLLYGSAQFSAYGMLSTLLPSSLPSAISTFTSGAIAGAFATTATYPLDLLRTRFAATGSQKIYPSLSAAVRTISATEGLPGFFRGCPAAIIQIVPYMGLFFGFYEALRAPLAEALPLPLHFSDGVAGVLASGVAKTGVFPLDLIRKRLQVQGPMRERFVHAQTSSVAVKGVWETGVGVVKREGVRGLYRGLTVGLAKAAPASAVTMWTYERVLRGLGQAESVVQA